jgi:hypothetical protein
MQANQQITFLTDGGEDIRDLPLYLNPQAEHLLDWFHITMRLTVMTNMAKSLPPPVDPDRSAPPDEAQCSRTCPQPHTGLLSLVSGARETTPGTGRAADRHSSPTS